MQGMISRHVSSFLHKKHRKLYYCNQHMLISSTFPSQTYHDQTELTAGAPARIADYIGTLLLSRLSDTSSPRTGGAGKAGGYDRIDTPLFLWLFDTLSFYAGYHAKDGSPELIVSAQDPHNYLIAGGAVCIHPGRTT